MTDVPAVLCQADMLRFVDGLPNDIDADTNAKLGAINIHADEFARFNRLDPFSPEYRRECEALYARLSTRTDYDPARDEKSGIGAAPHIGRDASPFNFRSSKLVSQFLASWAAIFDALDMNEGQSVLEYGPGSGQTLIMLARTGMRSFGVDIDPDSLALLRRQAEAMGLDIALEQGAFGEGFSGQRFDRILFFEAFHHALNFDKLLLDLHDRLLPGGKLVLCGEPIVGPGEPSVPYPWGPRADALSVFCMRRRGWMELGFRHDFLAEMMAVCGWQVRHIPSPVFRANTYVAEPTGLAIPLGDNIVLPNGWGAPEVAHRWTASERCKIPLPTRLHRSVNVGLKLANYLPEPKFVTVKGGQGARTVTIQSGQTVDLELGITSAPCITVETKLTQPPNDPRLLGVAAIECRVQPL